MTKNLSKWPKTANSYEFGCRYYLSRSDYLLILYVFLFSCVPADECGRVNNKLTIRNSDLLLTKVALAENSNCDGPNDVCCHEDDILYFYPEDKMCSAIDGYTYVLRKVFFYSSGLPNTYQRL